MSKLKVNLRKYKKSDIDRVCKIFINDNILKNLASEFKAKDIKKEGEEKWIQKNISNYKNKKPEEYALAIESNGEIVGSISIMKIDWHNMKAEMGYWVGEEYWGKGIATKAIKKFTKEVFRKFKLKRVEAYPYSYNKASQRVLEKAGYKLEGERRKAAKHHGKWLDDKIYAKIR